MAKGKESSRLLDAEHGHDNEDACCGEHGYENWIRPCFAEFFGTLIFVFVGGMSVVNGADPMLVATAHGLTILVMSVAFITVSGGHFNPAVTLAVLIVGYIKPVKALMYVFFQLAGAVAAAGIVRGLSDSINYGFLFGGTPQLNSMTSIPEAMGLEAILMFFVVLVVLVAEVDEENPLAPAAHGLAYLVSMAVSLNISGGCINIARSFGLAAVYSSESLDHWKEQWIFYVAGAIAAVGGAIIFKLTLASDSKRWACSENKKDE